VAFIMEKTVEGVIPVQIQINSATNKIYVKRNELANILCTIHDYEGRFVRSAENPIQFQIEGPGKFIGPDLVNAVNGVTQISFTDDSISGIAKIIASSPGLVSDTMIIEVTNRIWVDDFEGYKTITDLEYVWFIRSGTTANFYMGNSLTGKPGKALLVNYTMGDGNAPDAGVYKFIEEGLSLSEYLEFWLQGDEAITLAILLFDKQGRYWRYDHILSNNKPELFSIPFGDFTANDTSSGIKHDEIAKISFNILKGTGEFGNGILYLDDINFVIPATETGFRQEQVSNSPNKFRVNQNYPNPFNNVTTIHYFLPKAGKVSIEIFDISGRVVERLYTGSQKKAGEHHIRWQNNNLASGLYFYRIIYGKSSVVRKCILLR